MLISNFLIFFLHSLFITVCADDFDFISDQIDSSEFGKKAGKVATNCSCGWTNKSNKRIVGGVETNPHEYPLMGAVMYHRNSTYFCGATIISAYHGLSVAHCTVNLKNINLSIYIGLHDFADYDELLYLEYIKQTIEHEKYDENLYMYDISLLVFKEKIQFTNIIGPACLPKHKIDLTGKYVKIIGWGKTSFGGKTSNQLLKINSKVIPISNCAKQFPALVSTDMHQICTYSHNKDACQGDSGGPILWLDPETNRYTQVGIISFGKSCGEKFGAVQTDISYFMDWITTKMAETEPNSKICTKV